MAAIDDLNTAVAALQAEDVLVLAGLASLQAQVTTLNTTIANSPNVDPAIETAAGGAGRGDQVPGRTCTRSSRRSRGQLTKSCPGGGL